MHANDASIPFAAPAGDDALVELALAALRLPPGTALLECTNGFRQVLALDGQEGTGLTRLRCPAGIEAVAVCFECAAVRVGGQHDEGIIALAVHRSRRSATRLLRLRDGTIEPVDTVGGPLYDTVLRALGCCG